MSSEARSVYANNEPKSTLARDLGDCRDNKGKLAKCVFTCCCCVNPEKAGGERMEEEMEKMGRLRLWLRPPKRLWRP